MVNWVAIVTIVAIIGSIECNHPHHEPPADDSFADFARVHFMDKKRDEFMEMLPGVQSAIANNLNQFCKEGDCDTDVANFTSEHVDFYGANEKEKFFEDGRFIITKLFVKTGRDKVLSKEKVGEFIKTYRDKVVEEGKVQIAYINEELVYPQRNNIDNWIIVIASCLFCIILVSINLACTFKQKKEIKKEIIEREKKKQAKRNITHSSHASINSGTGSSRGPARQQSTSTARYHEIPIQYERDETRQQQHIPLMRRNMDMDDEDVRYLEPVQRFPLPADDPMLRTKRQQIRTNPHFKNTQV